MHNKFWNFKLREGIGELYLYGEISDVSWFGDEVTPVMFQEDLNALGDINELHIYINSPGGDAFAGITIYNMLARHPAKITVHVDGLAASIASIIAMAGDKIIMPRNATLMIHNAWTSLSGGAEKLRKTADELDRLNGQMAQIYADRSGKELPIVFQMMDEETWMDGMQAVENGFADEVAENKKIAASLDAERYFNQYKHPPQIDKTIQPPKGGFFMPEKDAEVQEGKTEPVADIDPLIKQRQKFNQIRKKFLEE